METILALNHSKPDCGAAITEVAHEKITFLHDYWSFRCRAGSLPTRRDIDPTHFAHRLPNLLLAQVEHRPLRFSIRVAGSKVGWIYRAPLTGKVLGGGAAPSSLEGLYRCLAHVVRTGSPHFSSGDLGWCGRDYLDFQQLVVPLGDADGTIGMVLGMTVAFDIDGREY